MAMETLIKEKNIYLGVVYIFRGLVYYCHGAVWLCAGIHGAGEKAEIPTS